MITVSSQNPVLVRDGELIALNGLTLLTPAFSLVFALLIYREQVSPLGMLGMAVVLVGVAWVGWPRHSTSARVRTRLTPG